MSSAYPLDAVETTRRAEVSSKERALAERVREQEARAAEVAQRRETIDAHDRESEAQRARDRDAMEKKHSAADVLLRRDWSRHRQSVRATLVTELERANAAFREAEIATQRARDELVVAKAELETVLRHREGWERDLRRATERKAERTLDELAVARSRPTRSS